MGKPCYFSGKKDLLVFVVVVVVVLLGSFFAGRGRLVEG